MALLEIANLTVEFATATGSLRAVDGVNLSVDESEILAIVGESGSGKSVAMLALMGLLPWTAKVLTEHFGYLIANRKTRVEAGHGFLKYHTDIFADDFSSLFITHTKQVLTVK